VETGEGHVRGGVPVVVGGRESRPQGEGGQETDRFLKPGESVDTDAKTDTVWLPSVQRKLYQWSRENPEGQHVCLANCGHKRGQANAGHRRGDCQFKVGVTDRLRYGLWKAECVTKGACSVRGGATGDRGLRGPTAPVVYSTN